MTRTPFPRSARMTTVVLVAVLGLAMAACGNDGGDDTALPAVQTTVPTTVPVPTTSATTTPTTAPAPIGGAATGGGGTAESSGTNMVPVALGGLVVLGALGAAGAVWYRRTT